VPLFRPEDLVDHVAWWQRAWHQARRLPPLSPLGWRTLQDTATVTGTILGGETADDGDTNFDLVVSDNLRIHCEVDPDDLAFFRLALLALEPGESVVVSGRLVADLGHGILELHPVTAIGEVHR